MKYSRISCSTVALIMTFVTAAVAADAQPESAAPSVEEIVNSSNCAAYYPGDSGRADVLIVIKDDKGGERMRQATMLRVDTDPDGCTTQKSYVYFHRPADLNKTAFLVWKNPDKVDDRWLYLPALDLVKRIADSDKRTSFVGSHYFYEDVTGRNINDDIHELVETTARHFVMKNTPKDPKSVEFTEYTVWIDRSNYIPMKVEYTDRSGAVYRVYEALTVETIQGHPTATRARISDSHIKGETTITFSNIRYDVELDEKVFAERYLRNPPRKYLQ